MIKTMKYWFSYVEAPQEIQARIRSMGEDFGYTTNRKDEHGRPIVSVMFMMHCDAASVRWGWLKIF